MGDPEKVETPEALVLLLAREKKELEQAPIVPVTLGPWRRCSLCGQSVPQDRLEEIEPPKPGEPKRFACPPCWGNSYATH